MGKLWNGRTARWGRLGTVLGEQTETLGRIEDNTETTAQAVVAMESRLLQQIAALEAKIDNQNAPEA